MILTRFSQSALIVEYSSFGTGDESYRCSSSDGAFVFLRTIPKLQREKVLLTSRSVVRIRMPLLKLQER